MPQKSINKIATLIAANLKRETDEPFKRMVADRVDFWRSTLIARSLEKHPNQRDFFTQTLLIPMECHSPIPCPTPMVMCNIMRSSRIVPAPMRFGTDLFDYVGTIDGDVPFGYAAEGTFALMKFLPYAGKKTFYEWVNRRIIIRNKSVNFVDQPIPMIRVKAVFDHPLDVFQFNCQTTGCDFWDEPYPATNDIVQMIIQYVLSVDFGQKVDKDTSNAPEIEVNPVVPKDV